MKYYFIFVCLVHSTQITKSYEVFFTYYLKKKVFLFKNIYPSMYVFFKLSNKFALSRVSFLKKYFYIR